MKRSVLTIAGCCWLLLVSLSHAATAEVRYDGFEETFSLEVVARDAKEVQRIPLFDNAPFLKLRAGDKLVIAKVYGKDEPFSFPRPEETRYCLCSGNRYYLLWTHEKDGKLLLSPAYPTACCGLLFDWDFTVEHARVLRSFLPVEYTKSITRDQYQAVLRAVALEPQPPTTKPIGDWMLVHFDEEVVMEIPGHPKWAEFHGVTFDSFNDQVIQYTLRIGPGVLSITSQTVVQGPPPVQRREFENTPEGINTAENPHLTPEAARAKKADYEKMRRFQAVVEAAIASTKEPDVSPHP